MQSGWRVSTYSSGASGNCVEVGRTDGMVLVRDTKNRVGAVLPVTATAWTAFLSKAR